MDILIIEQTEDTPYIKCDPDKGIFDFIGNSIPENVNMFYKPVLDWFDEYIQNPYRKNVFNFRMKMISSSSSKIFFDILNKADLLFEKKNIVVKVNWFYDGYDDEIREIGVDYKASIVAPFEIILSDTE